MANSEDVVWMACESHLRRFGHVANCAPCLAVTLDYVRAEVRALRKDRELLVKLHAAWTYPHAGSIGALLDEVAERVEPGIFGDAAMAAERGEGEVK